METEPLEVIVKIGIAVLLVVCLAFSAFSEVLYEEHFTDGSLTLDWFTPWPEGDELRANYLDSNPSGDNWVGTLTNENQMVGTALAGSAALTDYKVEMWMYVTVGEGTRHGIVARMDTTGGVYHYYYLRTNFNSGGMPPATPKLELRVFPGESGYGDDIIVWDEDTFPGGIPEESGWHKLGLECEGAELSAYWDEALLPGCPVTDSTFSNGFFGIYLFNFDEIAETSADDIIVTGEGSVVEDRDQLAIPSSTVLVSGYPNPFNSQTIITVNSPVSQIGSLTVYDVMGREVSVLYNGMFRSGIQKFSWQPEDFAAGVYFIHVNTQHENSTQKLVFVR